MLISVISKGSLLWIAGGITNQILIIRDVEVPPDITSAVLPGDDLGRINGSGRVCSLVLPR